MPPARRPSRSGRSSPPPSRERPASHPNSHDAFLVGRFDFLFHSRPSCRLASILVLASAKARPRPAPGLAAVGAGSSALRLVLAAAGGLCGGAAALGGGRRRPCPAVPLHAVPPLGSDDPDRPVAHRLDVFLPAHRARARRRLAGAAPAGSAGRRRTPPARAAGLSPNRPPFL